jgi:hypothetical protein
VPAAVTALAVVLWLVNAGGWPWGRIAVIGLLALCASIAVDYWVVMRHGARPFPTAPNADLPSVLKALYLQQKVTSFVAENQGADARQLHDAFGRFVAEHRPSDVQEPTQPSGVVRA